MWLGPGPISPELELAPLDVIKYEKQAHSVLLKPEAYLWCSKGRWVPWAPVAAGWRVGRKVGHFLAHPSSFMSGILLNRAILGAAGVTGQLRDSAAVLGKQWPCPTPSTL